ncbi:RICIN domain-containing protein [Shewanella benthica]|uniref:RICIN domain-containing protein n=1 Tax=Shewanella benthica TaxID=43661 RepID=UPI001D0D03EB|nr:hypothetical protein [Shewanella benthica]
MKTTLKVLPLSLAIAMTMTTSAQADQVILDDLIVDGSTCIGMDCVNGESFGFDTIRLKENNLRIRFVDTSSSSSFPSNDWQITANDSANGGANKFSIDDIDSGKTPFTIEARAPSHSLYVDDGGRIGLGTSTPVVDVHLKGGNTPTLRLEQDGTSGFTPQTWDVAGNEAGFFIRDATNGSTLPFRIRPGAPSSSIDIAASGNIGIGSTSPDAKLHVKDNSGTTAVHIEETNGTLHNGRVLLRLTNNGSPRIEFENTSNTNALFQINGNVNETFVITNLATDTQEFVLDAAGNLEIVGTLTTSGASCSTTPCDGVFKPEEYVVESIEEHADYMWKNAHLIGVGPTGKNEPFNLTTKTTGILHELEKAHIYIEQINNKLKSKESAIDGLTRRLDNLEQQQSL